MSKPTKNSRKTKRHLRKPSRKNLHKKRSTTGKKYKKRMPNKSAKLTRKNWMKKLIFTGGDASNHAENVFGGSGQQNAIGENNNAIYQNPLGSGIPGTNAGETQ